MKFRWFVVGVLVAVLMVPALLLTAARLVQPGGGLWVRLVSFTPYATVPYAVAFLLLVVATVRGRGRWRRAAGLLMAASLAGLLLHGWWASAPYVGTSTSPTTDAATIPTAGGLRVMSANLMVGQASAARVVELAVLNDVDLLVLQEVTPDALRRMRTAGLEQAFVDSAGAPGPGTTGTMAFSTRPLDGVTELDTKLGGYAMTVGGPGGPTTLLAVHPQPPTGTADGWADDQDVVRRAVEERDGPVLVVGDLNATADHGVVHDLFDLGLRDGAIEARSRWQPTWPAGGEVDVGGVSVPSLLTIDHVLVRGPYRAVRTGTVTIAGTDHRALVAILTR